MSSSERGFERERWSSVPETPSSAYTRRVEAMKTEPQTIITLPDEVLGLVARFLLGLDLLRASHVCGRLLRSFSRREIFAGRLLRVLAQLQSDGSDSKRDYASSRSLRFLGQPNSPAGQRVPRSYIRWSSNTFFGICDRDDDARPTSFTVDTWFSLSHADSNTLPGGVLLGVQSEKCRHGVGGRWPDFHEQILHVDTNRALYCSVTTLKPLVTASLESGRWYHVALVFEDEAQDVYVDGELVSSQRGQALALQNRPFYYAQVGTGCISRDSPGKPTANYCGWYGFHGVIDDLRIWHEALSAEQVGALSRGSTSVVALRRPMYSLRRDVLFSTTYEVDEVRCSRPRERWCEVQGICNRSGDAGTWV